MRGIVTACAALAALSLTGCDINTGAPKTVQADCHCTNLPAAAPPVTSGDTDYEPRPAHRHSHRHGYADSGSAHSYSWRREYSEVSVATYDYRSDSRSYTIGASDAAYSGDSAGGESHGGLVDDHDSATAGEPVHRAQGDRHGRLSPWHGYDADCPDRDRHN